ncbi:hypothetical protein UFOVP350_48 [uncultured Caudovirales phage]|uniref:Uncharacterized protein n=1 Tax=uncultured Caudovirales phage TaxID=2100421 RepID=A0A6J5M5W3_9CAUD|nr:hypothetical protein UFOVP350_48 [uncultured Caudovirales phage]
MSKTEDVLKGKDRDEIEFIHEQVKEYYNATVTLYRRTTELSYVAVGAALLVLGMLFENKAGFIEIIMAVTAVLLVMWNMRTEKFYTEGSPLSMWGSNFFTGENRGVDKYLVFLIENMAERTNQNDEVNRMRSARLKGAVSLLVISLLCWFLGGLGAGSWPHLWGL